MKLEAICRVHRQPTADVMLTPTSSFGNAQLGDILAHYACFADKPFDARLLPQQNKTDSARILAGGQAWVLKRHQRGAGGGNLLGPHWFQLQMLETISLYCFLWTAPSWMAVTVRTLEVQL